MNQFCRYDWEDHRWSKDPDVLPPDTENPEQQRVREAWNTLLISNEVERWARRNRIRQTAKRLKWALWSRHLSGFRHRIGGALLAAGFKRAGLWFAPWRKNDIRPL
jgi:hypothetical protein